MEKPLREDIYFGENPKNFQPNNIEYTFDKCEPLPKKYLDKLPEYFKIFCNPMIDPENKVSFDIVLTDEFYEAVRIHYNLNKKPSQDRLLKILDNELKIALDGFF